MITQEVVMDIVALHRQGHSMRFIVCKCLRAANS
jgi:hypothetical protein